jgi:hypothetical protein
MRLEAAPVSSGTCRYEKAESPGGPPPRQYLRPQCDQRPLLRETSQWHAGPEHSGLFRNVPAGVPRRRTRCLKQHWSP